MTTSRRLAAILVADVVGYSRMMEADEAGTLAALKDRRTTILEPIIKRHGGRVVKFMGDGVLVEFASAVNAVKGALELQEKFAASNENLPEERRIILRIGINLGDVVGEGSDIFGDGVNIAARLEALAQPGAICISAKVHDEVRGKIETTFEDMGEQVLKNIAMRVRAFRVAAKRKIPTGILAMDPLPLGKPSIAVLPFQNMSSDPEQDYFADGVVEDIITALSRRRQLFVIARNSSFTYKGRPVDIKQVGRELGVRYVLEGSLRRASDQLRITAQLIDAATGTHLWAERYDGALSDVFALQDEIAGSVAGAIMPTVDMAEIALAHSIPPISLDAYVHYLRGAACHNQWTAQASIEALSHFHRAIKLDPDYAAAYAFAAECYVMRKIVSSGVLNAAQTAEAERLALRAIALSPTDDVVMTFAASVIGYAVGDVRRGLLMVERALELNPNSASAWFFQSWNRLYAGQFGAAIEHCQHAMRLSPQDPLLFQMEVCIAHAHFTNGRPDEALKWAERALTKRPMNPDGLIVLTVSLVSLGKEPEAKVAFAQKLQIAPDDNLRNLPAGMPFVHKEHIELWGAALRKAGMPE